VFKKTDQKIAASFHSTAPTSFIASWNASWNAGWNASDAQHFPDRLEIELFAGKYGLSRDMTTHQ
jgi:hypothetical protein